MAFSPPGHRGLELLPPHLLGAIWGGPDWGNHMRQIVSSVLMVAMCIGSMASVIWILNFSRFNLMLIAGGCIAAVLAVALAEEFVEWRSRPRGKISVGPLHH